jgi:tryptophan-rich sensory protein
MRIWPLRAAIVVAAGLTVAGFWERMPGMTDNRLILYPVLLFPYALYALMTRERGPHLAVLLGGVLLLAGLWLWVMIQDPASGGPTLLFAVVTYLIASTVIGITATVLGRRSRPVSP